MHKVYNRRCNSSCSTNRQICAHLNIVMQKGDLMVFFPHQFLFIKQTYLNGVCNLVRIVSFGIYCSVSEWEKDGWVGGGLISNLNSVRLRFTAASWKNGYSCYISFFTTFALIYKSCLRILSGIWIDWLSCGLTLI